ncbi:type IV secretory system conjugative DNA transfer family protein [Salana multivorans]
MAIQAEEAKMRANKWFGVETAFKALDVPSVRAVSDVDPATAFDPEEFLRSVGTLYLVSQWRKSDMTGGSVGAFFSLVLDDIAQAVRRLSQDPAAGGRQDPPCTMVLDEIANIHPWPGLPLAAAAGSGEGLQVLVAFQSRSQAREAYGREVERSLWENSTALVLGASSDQADLKELSDLLGERTNQVRSMTWGQGGSVLTPTVQDSEGERALISVDELRRLPEHVLLMVQGRARPIVVTTIPGATTSSMAMACPSRSTSTTTTPPSVRGRLWSSSRPACERPRTPTQAATRGTWALARPSAMPCGPRRGRTTAARRTGSRPLCRSGGVARS